MLVPAIKLAAAAWPSVSEPLILVILILSNWTHCFSISIRSRTVFKLPPSAGSVFTDESLVIASIATICEVLWANLSAIFTLPCWLTKDIAEILVEFTEKFFEEPVTVGRVTSLPDASHSASVTVRVKAKSAVCWPAWSLPYLWVITLT